MWKRRRGCLLAHREVRQAGEQRIECAPLPCLCRLAAFVFYDGSLDVHHKLVSEADLQRTKSQACKQHARGMKAAAAKAEVGGAYACSPARCQHLAIVTLNLQRWRCQTSGAEESDC